MKFAEPRKVGSPAVASCRFDRTGYPTPNCMFTVCADFNGERWHAYAFSGNGRNCTRLGRRQCTGEGCERYMEVKTLAKDINWTTDPNAGEVLV